MNQIDHLESIGLQEQTSFSQHVPSRTLDSGLENTGADQIVSAPLPSEGVLTSDSNSISHETPWSQLLLNLGITPTDKPPTW